MKVNSRQTIILVLLLAFAGFFIYRYVVKPEVGGDTTELPAKFAFTDNLAATFGEIVPLEIEVGEDVSKVDLIFNDSIFKTWSNPSGKLSFDLDAGFFGLGAKSLVLKITSKNGNISTDERLMRIVSDIVPEQWTAEVVQSYPHQESSFTQGLEFSKGVLFESTGDPNHNGSSIVSKVNLQTGATLLKNGLDATYFGEGITVMKDQVYQLTWREQKCFVYDETTLESKLKSFVYTGEGWGLCNDGKSIIMSDGSERLVFRNPDNFQIERSIEVYDNVGPRSRLNELEYIDGKIYANVWMLDIILVIDPNSGKVLAEIDASSVVATGKGSGEVLNGIAYNPANNKLYLTGKLWPKLLEVKINKGGAI